jgi:2-dehydro-3-deoxyphosphooctonate aldolase (KDO 8-P synthase)
VEGNSGEDEMVMKTVMVGEYRCGNGEPLLWILGPCVIETEKRTLEIAHRLMQIGQSLHIPIVFKASFDKANRSSGKSFRGLGMAAGLAILAKVKQETGLPVTTDLHETIQVAAVAEVCDLLQIPAFLARQTDLVQAAAATGRAVNVKKGQFMAPWDMNNVVKKVEEMNNPNLLLTERGTTFGYGNLVNDMRAIPWMQDLGRPVIFDATHSVQTPGSQGDSTGGDRRMVPYLAKAAVAVGCDGLFLETHPVPEESPSDGPNMIPLDQIESVIESCLRVRDAISPRS